MTGRRVVAVAGMTPAAARLPPCTERPEVFFPPDQYAYAGEVRRVRAAQSLCARCPLVRECGEGAVSRREQWGVWGGKLFTPARPGVPLDAPVPSGRPGHRR